MWFSTVCDRLSAISPALFRVLADNALKGAAVLLLTLLAVGAMKRASAAARHLVLFLGAASLLVLPIFSAALPGWYILPNWIIKAPPVVATATQQPARTPVAMPALTPAQNVVVPPTAPEADLPSIEPSPQTPAVIAPTAHSPAPSTAPKPAPAVSHFHPTWQAYCMLAWLGGALLYLGYLLFGSLSLSRLRRRSAIISEPAWLSLLSELQDELHFRQAVQLISSSSRAMPMTWGIFKTWILLPTDASHWTASQRRAVLSHELAHARRWDCLTQLVVQLACALHWVNPLIWYAWQRMQAEREQACDDLVLSTGTKASAYAEQLLQIASEMPAVRYSAAAIAMARPSTLEGRLLAILDAKRNRRALSWTGGAMTLLLVAAISTSVSMLRAQDTKAKNNPATQPSQMAAQDNAPRGPRTVVYRRSDSRDPDHPQKVSIDERGYERIDKGNGSVVVIDAVQGKQLNMDPPAIKSARVSNTVNLRVDNPIFSVSDFEKWADPGANPVSSLSRQQLAGHVVDGEEFETNGTRHIVWHDSETHQPVEIDLLMPTDPSSGPGYKVVYDQIALDTKLDNALFSLQPPAGYLLERGDGPIHYEQQKDVSAALSSPAADHDSLPLRNARRNLAHLDEEYRLGLANVIEHESAVWDVKVQEAMQTRDPVQTAKVQLDRANSLLQEVDLMFHAGLVSGTELHDAKGEAKLRQAELKALSSGATSNPASRQTNVEAVQLENAKQHLNDVEQLYRAGLDTPLNYTRAQWDVKVLEAEQTGDTLKAAKARLDRAGEILKLVDSMYRGGLGTQVDLRDAQQEVKRCRAEFDAARGTPVPQFGQPATTRSVWQSGDPPPGSVAVTQEAREMDGKPGATHPATNPALAAQPAILDFRIAAWIDDKIGKPTGNLFPLSAAVQHVQDR